MELEQQSVVAKDRANLAKKQIAEIETIDRALENRTASYRSGAIERLGQQIAEAEAEKRAASRKTNSASTSVPGWSNWLNRVTRRKFAQPKLPQRRRKRRKMPNGRRAGSAAPELNAIGAEGGLPWRRRERRAVLAAAA